jgi:hypothetical protein
VSWVGWAPPVRSGSPSTPMPGRGMLLRKSEGVLLPLVRRDVTSTPSPFPAMQRVNVGYWAPPVRSGGFLPADPPEQRQQQRQQEEEEDQPYYPDLANDKERRERRRRLMHQKGRPRPPIAPLPPAPPPAPAPAPAAAPATAPAPAATSTVKPASRGRPPRPYDDDCPACRGRHRAHTCGWSRGGRMPSKGTSKANASRSRSPTPSLNSTMPVEATDEEPAEFAAAEGPTGRRLTYVPAHRTHRGTAGAGAAAAAAAASAAAQSSASAAAPKRHWQHSAPTDSEQAADGAEFVEEEEDDEQPVPKRQRGSGCAKSSEFVGVSWSKRNRRWEAQFRHDGKKHHVGYFDDEREAGRAVDKVARRLRGEDAHGVRSGNNWVRLNFPTKGEVQRAKERGALLAEEDGGAAAAAAASERQSHSEFVGVSRMSKRDRIKRKDIKWKAQIKHDGKNQHLGCFDDEREAARAVDTAARQLRGDDAHGGRSGKNWNRLNFPTQDEAKRAKERGALLEEWKTPAPSTAFVGVSWSKHDRKWRVRKTPSVFECFSFACPEPVLAK